MTLPDAKRAVTRPASEARAQLSEVIGQARFGTRTVIEVHGKPAAAVVSLGDLARLRALQAAGITRPDQMRPAAQLVLDSTDAPSGAGAHDAERED